MPSFTLTEKIKTLYGTVVEPLEPLPSGALHLVRCLCQMPGGPVVLLIARHDLAVAGVDESSQTSGVDPVCRGAEELRDWLCRDY